MIAEQWKAWMHQVDWRELLTSYPGKQFGQLVCTAAALIILGESSRLLIPREFYHLTMSYVGVMTFSAMFGLMAFEARWWLVWLVGTLLWQSAMLTLYVWWAVKVAG